MYEVNSGCIMILTFVDFILRCGSCGMSFLRDLYSSSSIKVFNGYYDGFDVFLDWEVCVHNFSFESLLVCLWEP